MADVRLPGTLTPLFPGLTRKPVVEGATVLEVIDRLETQWPGLRDRLVAERPGLDSPVEERSRLDVIAAISGG
jgi:hypothetical protein